VGRTEALKDGVSGVEGYRKYDYMMSGDDVDLKF
jgi:hypothetical protein